MLTDPVTLEVLRNALQSIAEEMGATLVRTALSPNIKDRRDCSTAVYTPSGSLVAQAEHIPLHLGLMPTVVKSVLEHFSWNEMNEGDAIIINDPYISGSHLPDICVLTPVFHGGKPLAIVANLAHHVDIGGAVPGSMSTTTTEIFQEGIRIPPLKLCSKGRLRKDMVKLLAHNLRTPAEFYGDIQAQLAANHTGSRRLKELASRYGSEKLSHYMQEIIDYAERSMRAALSSLPRGTFTFEDYLEGDGITEEKIKIRASVTITEDKLKVDFTGTSPQVPGPVNATRGVTLACVLFAARAVIDPELPSSEGMARPIEVITPPGTLVNPVFPAPVAHANINTAQRITDVILGAFAQAVPERVTAAGTGSMSNFTIGGIHPRHGSYYSYVETYGGGQGAMCDRDGMDGVHVNMTNTRNTPVEVIELTYPLLVEKYALIPDSGGPGRFRGGTGIERVITILDHEATVSVSTERTLLAPWGLAGGLPGSRAECRVGKDIITPGKFTRRVPPGTTVTLKTAGGGGFGPPWERDPEAVREDVLDELVSLEAAQKHYGVVFKPGKDLEVDYEATQKLRRSKK